jgi:predicted nucleic acid-binding protein
MIMLDTTACIDFLKGNTKLKALLLTQDPYLAITPISIYEIMIGLHRTKRQRSKSYFQETLRVWAEFRSSLKLYPIDRKEAECAAEIYDELETQGKIIDDNDILIAGVMRANDITRIATRNKKHFQKIDQIEVLDYY